MSTNMHQEDAHLTNVKLTSLFWKGYLNKVSISVCGTTNYSGRL